MWAKREPSLNFNAVSLSFLIFFFICFCILNNMLFGIVRCLFILLPYCLSSYVNYFREILCFPFSSSSHCFVCYLVCFPHSNHTVCLFSISNMIFLLLPFAVFPVRWISIHFVELFWWKISIINQVYFLLVFKFWQQWNIIFITPYRTIQMFSWAQPWDFMLKKIKIRIIVKMKSQVVKIWPELLGRNSF